MDRFTTEKRSEVMSKIRSKNTKLEIYVRHLLFERGFRYRLNRKNLLGQPDIVLTKWKTVIFVNGCFWHAHQGCKKATIPETRADFWRQKLDGNRARDQREYATLLSMGWRVLVVWQCACLKTRSEALGTLMESFLRSTISFAEIGRDDVEGDPSTLTSEEDEVHQH